MTVGARVRLELSDNGIGSPSRTARTGFGLTGIRERIEVLGGRVEAANRAGGGFAMMKTTRLHIASTS